jgi:RNA polymerase sigma-70 factor (ECF subfamily)
MKNHPAPANSDLDLGGVVQRRPDAVEAWFTTYADPVYTFIYYRVGKDPEIAADVTQDTFTTALDKIAEYQQERGEMLPWLTYVARNCIRKTRRRQARYTMAEDLWERIDQRLISAFSALAEEPLPDEVLLRQETAELVRMALSNLPCRYQRALEQRYYQQQTVKEIAASEGITEGAVKSLLHRARAAFQVAFTTIAETISESHSAAGGLV